jgi:hypothetical protein
VTKYLKGGGIYFGSEVSVHQWLAPLYGPVVRYSNAIAGRCGRAEALTSWQPGSRDKLGGAEDEDCPSKA